MKTKSKPTPPSNPPVNLVVPNTIGAKMQAIVNTSLAILELARALNSVNVHATISDNHIVGAQCGISIDTAS